MTDDAQIVSEIETLGEKIKTAKAEIEKRIIGQGRAVDLTLNAILSGGHALLIGLPGLGKTRLVETASHVLGLTTARIQFTPDLMPADILGSEVLEAANDGSRSFRFLKGPVFCQLLMADEINRASPRTQSALLQAMQERQVTIGGTPHDLPNPFHVLATQNPIEQEGTYPLPEAQLDRFLFQITLGHPAREAEEKIILETTGSAETQSAQVLSADDVMAAQALLRRVPVGEAVVARILDVVRAFRPDDDSASDAVRSAVAWGPGPRASQALMMAVRAHAIMDGRLAPSTNDVAELAAPVLGHRMALGYGARADGLTTDALIASEMSRLGGAEAAA